MLSKHQQILEVWEQEEEEDEEEEEPRTSNTLITCLFITGNLRTARN
jgi:hypothetical protein